MDLFRNYSMANGFYPAYANRVELDVIDPYTAFESLAGREDVSEESFKQVFLARWALIEASDEAVFKTIVQNEGRPYVAWLTLIETYAPDTFVSRGKMLDELVNVAYRPHEDPIFCLNRLEMANYKMREVGRVGMMKRS